MFVFRLYLLLLVFLSEVTPKELSDVFTSFNSLTFTDAGYGYRGPSNPTWHAKLSWNLNGAYARPGDTFGLVLPHVFKFVTAQSYFTLSAGGVTYAICDFQPGELFTTFSSIKCTVSEKLNPNIEAFGTITFPFAFGVGGSGSDTDLVNSNSFTTGENRVTFKHGSKDLCIDVDFQGSPAKTTDLLSYGRIIPSLRKISHLLTSADSPNGYKSGKLGLASSDAGLGIDCDSVHVGITNMLNPWNQPMNAESFSYTTQCSEEEIMITFNEVPEGYRPFFDVLFSHTASDIFTMLYTNEYVGADGVTYDASMKKAWKSYQDSLPSGDGAIIIVTTRTGTQSTTAVSTLPYEPEIDLTKTIEVLVPIPTTTTTTSYLGVSTYYSTITATIGATATVIVDEPYHTTTTITTCWDDKGATTFTQIAESHSVDTIYIKTQHQNPTFTTTLFEDVPKLTTVTRKQPCGGIDTLSILYPNNPFTTYTTIKADAVVPTTYTETDTHGGTDTVVVVYPPNPTITTTGFDTVEELTTTTQTDTHGGTDTVVVVYPPNPTITTTGFDTVEELTTTTQTDTHGGTDTVIVVYPPNPLTTRTEIDSNLFEPTTYTETDTHGGTDTVVEVLISLSQSNGIGHDISMRTVTYSTSLQGGSLVVSDHLSSETTESEVDGSQSTDPGDDEFITNDITEATYSTNVDEVNESLVSDFSIESTDFYTTAEGIIFTSGGIMEDELFPSDSVSSELLPLSSGIHNSTQLDSTLITDEVLTTLTDVETSSPDLSSDLSDDILDSTSDDIEYNSKESVVSSYSESTEISVIILHTSSIAAADPITSSDNVSGSTAIDYELQTTNITNSDDVSTVVPGIDISESVTSSDDVSVDNYESASSSSALEQITQSSEYILTTSTFSTMTPKYENITYPGSLAAPGPIYSDGALVGASTEVDGFISSISFINEESLSTSGIGTTESYSFDSSTFSYHPTSVAITIPADETVTVIECSSDCTLSISGGSINEDGNETDVIVVCTTCGSSYLTDEIIEMVTECTSSCSLTSSSQSIVSKMGVIQSSLSDCGAISCGKNHDVGLSHTTRVNGIATDKPEVEDNDGHTTLIHSNPEINDQHDEIEKGNDVNQNHNIGQDDGLNQSEEVDHVDYVSVTVKPYSDSTLSTAILDYGQKYSILSKGSFESNSLSHTTGPTNISNYEGSASYFKMSCLLVYIYSFLSILI
uniref:Agglutinin-like protein n=1 Tax=Candida tropicalis TaxID=5482 RepID=A0A345ZDD4_CANTR|nr:agglutinin-like protein [Candida tropicalis]AXK68413.1 agglutinin-like protein [Candida tropicalis]AXK68445.1 agglutinin-like protein [Candida tropicalis]AXK68446.1 agglutinin-like protein [Candida tropicalis]AXK68465.1 agglutinin-like protein [Candida tropicalis]